MAHFEPVELPVHAVGVYPSLALSLPRDAPPEWPTLLESAKAILTAKARSVFRSMLFTVLRQLNALATPR